MPRISKRCCEGMWLDFQKRMTEDLFKSVSTELKIMLPSNSLGPEIREAMGGGRKWQPPLEDSSREQCSWRENLDLMS